MMKMTENFVADAATLAQHLKPHLQPLVDAAVAPLRQQITDSNNRLQQALLPQQSANGLFAGGSPSTPGQAPFVQSGEFQNTSRGYQYFRALALRQGILPPDQAKVEMEVHNRLSAAYRAQGFTPSSGQSILVPMGPSLLADLGEQFAAEMGQMLHQGVSGIDRDQYAWMLQQAGLSPNVRRQSLSQFDDSGLGNFVGPALTGGLIELIRKKEVMSRLGATEIGMPPNGRLRFDKQTGACTAYWLGEVPSNASSPTITASEPTTGGLDLQAKKLGCLVKLPNELLRFASIAIEAFVRNDMTRVISLEADRAMLDGSPTGTRIKGLLYYAVTNYTPILTGTDGNTLSPEDLGLMVAELEDDDHDTESPTMGWLMRGRMWRNLLNRRSNSHATGIHDGPWLFNVNRADIATGAPGLLDGYKVVRSSQVSNARSKGASNDLTYVLLGLWEHWLIARMGVVEFALSTQGDTAFTTDQTWVRAIQHIDAAPRYENAFVAADAIDMDLPVFTGT
jgi:HK97 family phage major capsid protein